MSLRFCIDPATIGFDVKIEEYVSAAAAGGFEAVEWPMAAVETRIGDASILCLRELFRAHDVEPLQFTSGFGVPGNLAVADEAFEQRLPEFDLACTLARRVGTSRASLFFDLGRHEGVTLGMDRVVDRARRVAAVAAGHRIRLVIGWHDASLLETVGSTYTRADGEFGLLIDTFTLHQAGFGPELVEALPNGSVEWIRVGDAAPGTRRSARLLPGHGVVDIRGIVQACSSIGYSGPLSIETTDPALEKLAPAERAQAAHRAMVEFFG
jgi:sugar phosphate isomerase/epimerase